MTTDIDAAKNDLVHLWTSEYGRESTVYGPTETARSVITPAWNGVFPGMYG
jgi:hypothetical protein